MKRPATVIAFAVISGLAAIDAQTGRSADTLLARARHMEVVDGDAQAAIVQYQQIVERFKMSDRRAAAEAMLQIARSFEKLGRPDARDVYQAILRDFADQPVEVSAARAGLAVAAERNQLALLCMDCSDQEGSISRDGRWMVSTDWVIGDLVVRDLKRGKSSRLMVKPGSFKESQEMAQAPVFSPDARQIAYNWEPGDDKGPGQLRVVKNERGATARTVLTDAETEWTSPLAWSSDGKRLVVEVRKPDKTRQLAWVTIANGDVTIVKSLDSRLVRTHQVSLSPDDRYIAYSALVSNPSQPVMLSALTRETQHVYVIAADGRGEVEISHDSHDEMPTWSPDGNYLLFGSTRTGTMDLWAVRMREGKPVGQRTLVSRNLDWAANYGVTASNVLHFQRLQPSFNEVVVAHVDTTGPLPASVRVAERFVGQNPSWSPDGTLLEFARPLAATGDTDYDLIVHSFKTAEDRKLSRAGLRNGPVRWLRDGGGFLQLFRSAAASPDRAWTRVGVASGAFETLTPFSARRSGAATLAPDDRTIYHFDGRSTLTGPFSQIVAVDLATAQERIVFTLPGPPEALPRAAGAGLAVSPDGRTLALLLLHPQTSQAVLATVGIDGTGYREVFKGFKLNSAPDRLSWTRDGRSLLFAMQSDGSGFRIMRIGAAGGAPEFTGLEVERLGTFSVSSDGQRIAYHQVLLRRDELWALDVSAALPKVR